MTNFNAFNVDGVRWGAAAMDAGAERQVVQVAAMALAWADAVQESIESEDQS